MKKIYIIPQALIVPLKAQDIITSSPNSLQLHSEESFSLNNGEEF